MSPSSLSAPLTPCQTKALDILEREGNVFLTGAAGTGKSFLLDRYLSDKPAAYFPVVASTGAAAVIVGGRTFHSFFGLGILEGGVTMAVAKALKNRKVVHRLNQACCVVIDEVSMLSGATLKAAEMVARRARGIDLPWGGLKIIAVGDFAQLPPITHDQMEKDWAFRHEVWEESAFQPALLSTVMRTSDRNFLEILNFVREGIVNDRVEEFLHNHTVPASDASEGTRLYPHRNQAEQYNLRKLESVPRQLHTFQTTFDGSEHYRESAKKSLPIPDTLLLKVGALVMMRKNDASGEMRYVNGSLGHVENIAEEELQIRLLSGERIEVVKEKFSLLDGDGKEVLAAWNFPVTLAWATTIHKAQGASLDRLIVDLHALWEPGQAYVALSRVRSGDGLLVERWSASSIRAEPLVTAFYDSLTDQASKYVPRPLFIAHSRVSEEAEHTPRKATATKKTRIQRMRQIASLIKEQVSLDNIATTCGIKPQRVILYLEKMLESGEGGDLQYLVSGIPHHQKIAEAFEEFGHEHLAPVFEVFEGEVPYDDLRLVRVAMIGAR
ncbi:MAG: helix-turn-helix domain-containing protein [Candidatus Peregrinibacteria bacterium]